jgi:hypothetical protein
VLSLTQNQRHQITAGFIITMRWWLSLSASLPVLHTNSSDHNLDQVEDHHFRIHRHFLLRESEVFGSMLAHSNVAGNGVTIDEHAICRPDVTCQEFETLLDFFYEGYVHRYPSSPDINVRILAEFTTTTTSRWTTGSRLSPWPPS